MSCPNPVPVRRCPVRSLMVGDVIVRSRRTLTVEDIYREYDGGNFRIQVRVSGTGLICRRTRTLSLAGSNRVTVLS